MTVKLNFFRSGQLPSMLDSADSYTAEDTLRTMPR